MHGLIFETSISLLAGSTRYLIKKKHGVFLDHYITTQKTKESKPFFCFSKSIRVFQWTRGLFLLWHSHKQPLKYQKLLLGTSQILTCFYHTDFLVYMESETPKKSIWIFKYQHHHCELSPLRLASEQRLTRKWLSPRVRFCRTIQYGYKFPFLAFASGWEQPLIKTTISAVTLNGTPVRLNYQW